MKKGDKRLLFLADRLLEIPFYEINGKKVPNKRVLGFFDFTVMESHINLESCGCALGEGRYLFKKPFLNLSDSLNLFQITHMEALHLFQPNSQFDQSCQLDLSATAAAVAVNIINFVEKRVSG